MGTPVNVPRSEWKPPTSTTRPLKCKTWNAFPAHIVSALVFYLFSTIATLIVIWLLGPDCFSNIACSSSNALCWRDWPNCNKAGGYPSGRGTGVDGVRNGRLETTVASSCPLTAATCRGILPFEVLLLAPRDLLLPASFMTRCYLGVNWLQISGLTYKPSSHSHNHHGHRQMSGLDHVVHRCCRDLTEV